MTRPKRLTQRQAWLRLARNIINGQSSMGLCVDMCRLSIYRGAERSMLARLHKEVRKHAWHPEGFPDGSGWAWPANADGDKQRIAFCRAQVRRLDKAKAKRAAK